MKMDGNIFKVIPSNLGKRFGFCVYGDVDALDFAKECNLKIEKAQSYTNFYPTEETDFDVMFPVKKFKYMDGFSPNLNKHLHIGHFSNFVLAKAFQKMGVTENTVSILGDTVAGEVSKEDALSKLNSYCDTFDFGTHKYFASEMKYSGTLTDGEGQYAGAKIIQSGDDKIVVIKSNGATSYFYQDLALAEMLNAETLYLTGYEQENHFKLLKSSTHASII